MRLPPVEIPVASSLDDLRQRILVVLNQLIDTINVSTANTQVNGDNRRVINVAPPTGLTDAVNKGYLDNRLNTLTEAFNRRSQQRTSVTSTIITTGLVFPNRDTDVDTTTDDTDTAIWADTTSAPVTVYLEATPTDGKLIIVKLYSGINTMTIDGNGNTIDLATSISTTSTGAAFMLVYSAFDSDWKRIN